MSREAKGVSKEMKKRVFALVLCALLFALCSLLLAPSFPVHAQQATKIPRIGYVSASGDSIHPGPSVEAFRRGLRVLGYIEGKNIQVDYRYLEGVNDRLQSFVADLVQHKVDILVATSPSAILAAKRATKTIPIVIVTTQDPVAAGIVDSLARPGGNITGVTRLTRELSGKRLDLLKEVVPGISRIGVLSVEDTSGMSNALKEYEAAARAQKITLKSLMVHGPNPDLEGAFREAAISRVSALIPVNNTVLLPYQKKIADLAIKNRMPLMVERGEFVEAGGLTSYSANDAEIFRRAGWYVDKILKGAKPGDLPVEQPTKFELVINLKTAKQIGLTIPPNVLARADRVIR
jgi:putative tryptophan/tyrosine transport system substrate-binding protein